MPFDAIRGQATAIETLTRAIRAGLVHHAYRFEGPEGVGKELTAIAFAQALLCHGGSNGCGTCDTCRRIAQRNPEPPAVPLHPDVVLVGRGVYPPDTIGGKRETNEISVEQIRRVILARAAYAPHEGRAQVFIVRDAEQLSISAANALLKTLEEPRPATHFVLVTARAERLLDTIRSRTLPVRFGPLPDDVVAHILRSREVAEDRIPALVEIAAGSASLAIDAADPEASAAREAFVREMERAVEAPDLATAIQLAESLDRDRPRMADDLRALGGTYARRARTLVSTAPAAAELEARRHALVLDAIDSVERNGSAPLLVTSLVASLRHGGQRRPGVKPAIVQPRR
jgi:DNA polymerase III subunit delta'